MAFIFLIFIFFELIRTINLKKGHNCPLFLLGIKKFKPVELAQAKFKAEIESSISSQRSLKT